MIKIPIIDTKNVKQTLSGEDFKNYRSILPLDFKNKTGQGIKISLIGTGLPSHSDFKKLTPSFEVFDENSDTPDDIYGYSSALAGIIASESNDGINGIAPNSDISYVKSFNNNGEGEYPAIVAGVIWSIAKSSNIIHIPLNKQENYIWLKEAAEKAYKMNIPVFVSLKNNKVLREEIPWIIAITWKYSTKNKIKIIGKNKEIEVLIPKNKFYSTIGENYYIEANPFVLSSGIVLGVASLILQNTKSNKNIVDSLCEKITSLEI